MILYKKYLYNIEMFIINHINKYIFMIFNGNRHSFIYENIYIQNLLWVLIFKSWRIKMNVLINKFMSAMPINLLFIITFIALWYLL